MRGSIESLRTVSIEARQEDRSSRIPPPRATVPWILPSDADTARLNRGIELMGVGRVLNSLQGVRPGRISAVSLPMGSYGKSVPVSPAVWREGSGDGRPRSAGGWTGARDVGPGRVRALEARVALAIGDKRRLRSRTVSPQTANSESTLTPQGDNGASYSAHEASLFTSPSPLHVRNDRSNGVEEPLLMTPTINGSVPRSFEAIAGGKIGASTLHVASESREPSHALDPMRFDGLQNRADAEAWFPGSVGSISYENGLHDSAMAEVDDDGGMQI
jgi:hypothetical protein